MSRNKAVVFLIALFCAALFFWPARDGAIVPKALIGDRAFDATNSGAASGARGDDSGKGQLDARNPELRERIPAIAVEESGGKSYLGIEGKDIDIAISSRDPNLALAGAAAIRHCETWPALVAALRERGNPAVNLAASAEEHHRMQSRCDSISATHRKMQIELARIALQGRVAGSALEFMRSAGKTASREELVLALELARHDYYSCDERGPQTMNNWPHTLKLNLTEAMSVNIIMEYINGSTKYLESTLPFSAPYSDVAIAAAEQQIAKCALAYNETRRQMLRLKAR